MLRVHTLRPAVLAVTDEDAKSYLQSQFSNDLNRSEERPVTYGLFLDRKGKVLHDALILQRGEEDFLLVSYHSDAEALQRKVEENIIADEVEIEDVSSQFKLVTIWGDHDALEKMQPPSRCFAESGGAYIFASRRTGLGALDCLISADAEWPPADWPAEQASNDEQLAERINAGLPAIPQDIGPRDLPHEGADLATAAVSYTKGCYLGQEVMARLHAMGQAQRAIFRVSFAPQSNDAPLPVFAGEKEIGAVTSHAGGQGLALLKRRYVGGEAEPCIAKPGGNALTILHEIRA